MSYDELLRLAEAATPGPWKYPVGGAVVSVTARDNVIFGEVRESDSAYIAAASPDVVAALIRENRQQAERLEQSDTCSGHVLKGHPCPCYCHVDPATGALRGSRP